MMTVEPTAAPSLLTSLENGAITPIRTGHTICNGMNCGTVSTTAWKVLKEGVDGSVTVEDAEVHRDVVYLHGRGVRCGPCGAATLTALRKVCREGKGKGELGLGGGSVVVLFSTEGERGYEVPEEA